MDDSKKKAILESAKSLFLGQGFNATTIQAIANAAGVSKGSVYLHFDSKKEIFFDLLMQLEESIWQKVNRVCQSDATAPKKLSGVLEIYFDFIQENRLFGEMQIHEVGLALSEEMLRSAQSLRIRWQEAIDSCVAEFIGAGYTQWRGDLGFAVTGLMESFNALMLVDKVQISKQSVTDFIILLIKTMPAALKKANFEPMFSPQYLSQREQMMKDLTKLKQLEVEEILSGIQKIVESEIASGAAPEQAGLLNESVTLLAKECRAKKPKLFIIQGMLANLRTVTELASLRNQLAELMGVKLV